MATTRRSLFTLEVGVEASIRATPAAIWARLTDAEGFPSWNSTVTRIDGPIALGRKLSVRVPAQPDRAFTPTVTVFEPERRMVWADGFFPMFRGARTFTLTPDGEHTRFAMSERLDGLMLPMIRGSLPDFAPIFDQYVADLERACEG